MKWNIFLVLKLTVFVNYVFENVTLTPVSSSSLYNSEQIKWKPASHGLVLNILSCAFLVS